jgi:hypothetical protein
VVVKPKLLSYLAPALLAGTFLIAADQPQLKLPQGYVIPPSSVSPNREYGVSAFDNTVNPIPDEIDENKIVDLHTSQIVGIIHGSSAMIHMNHEEILPARWSPDGSLLLWEVEGKWSPSTLTLLRIEGGKVKWALDVLRTVQQAILVRTRQVAPQKYAAAKKENKGNGFAFPDGFTVNVRVEGDKERGGATENVTGEPISLPLKVHAELTSNPKETEDWPQEAQLDSELDGVITPERQLNVTRFRLREKPFSDATSSSWLELTNPEAAAQPPLEYGDVVSLTGKVTKRQDPSGNPAYVLVLNRTISIPASGENPTENNVSEIRLLGLEQWGDPDNDVDRPGTFEADGTLGYEKSHQVPPVTLRVQGTTYTN